MEGSSLALHISFHILYLTLVCTARETTNALSVNVTLGFASKLLLFRALVNPPPIPPKTDPSTMSYHNRHSLLQQSTASTSSSTSSTLATRITQKKAELENLRALRDLSAQLASQIAVLETKLGMLSDGTEGVAEVLRNWRGVLGVLGVVGGELGRLKVGGGEEGGRDGQGELPGTLVRIPVGTAEGEKEEGKDV